MRITPAVKIILIVNLVFFALSELITPMFPLGGYTDWFTAFNALHPIGSSNFAVYQYVTYMFMHGGWMHLFFNMWSLMIFGNSVEMQVGTKRFVYYYLICGVGSALINQLMSFLGIIPPSILVGASGAIYGVMAAAAYYFPNAKLFIIPIPFPVKLRNLVIFYTVFEMYNGVMSSFFVAIVCICQVYLYQRIILLIRFASSIRLRTRASSPSAIASRNSFIFSIYVSITCRILSLFCERIGVHISGLLLARRTVEENPPEARSNICFSSFSLSSTVRASANEVTCEMCDTYAVWTS